MTARPTPAFPLFVPADRPERIAKACRAGSDGVIVDLEDAVPPERRAASRNLPDDVREARAGISLLLRVNAVGTPWHDDDVSFGSQAGFDGVVLAKAETPDAVDGIRSRLPEGCAVVVLIETVEGLSQVDAIARASDRLCFGSIDFAEDLGCAHTRQALLLVRTRMVPAARLAGRPPPLDGVTAAVRDAEAVGDDAAHALELGFDGTLVIHPAQIAAARQAFRPDPATVDWARRVLAADHGGAALLDGAMVDAPVVARARRIAARAET